jgi:hypothetical protein
VDARLREAMISLSMSPDWAVYDHYVRNLLTIWGEEALTPGLSYEQTEALRQARTRVETEILSLPGEARRQEDEK